MEEIFWKMEALEGLNMPNQNTTKSVDLSHNWNYLRKSPEKWPIAGLYIEDATLVEKTKAVGLVLFYFLR